MLDPKFLRENPELVRQNIKDRRLDADLDTWLRIDQERLEVLKQVEGLREERNQNADAMKSASAETRAGIIEKGKALKDSLSITEEALGKLDAAWKDLLSQFPNQTHPDAPIGPSDDESVELRQVGSIDTLDAPRDHVALCVMHDWVDFERAAKVSGTKFYFLKNELVLLEQALVRWTLDFLRAEGFTLLQTPDLAKDAVIVGAGYAPRGPETQIYSIEQSDLSLVGTAEITIGGYHQDEMLDRESLPRKYAGLSHCYRTEAGTYGKESYGLYRVHQFTKVEMFCFTTPEQSEAMHLELLRLEEAIFSKLGIPFRVIDTASGELGGPAYRKYDLEAWMWGREGGKGGWGEITSASNCTDYQARRLNIRTKSEEGKSIFVHTLNGTAISLCRAMVAFLENHQQPDGTIRIPEILIPYFGSEVMGA